jgi:hypothetical protein
VKWLAEECFDNDIIRGLLRRSPDLDLVRARTVARAHRMQSVQEQIESKAQRQAFQYEKQARYTAIEEGIESDAAQGAEHRNGAWRGERFSPINRRRKQCRYSRGLVSYFSW